MEYWKEFIKAIVLGVAIFAILYFYIFVFA